MSEDSEAFIREIEEEVRRERLTNLWKQYGSLFLGGLAALVVVVGGWQWYTVYQLDRTQTAGAQFQEAVQLLEGKKMYLLHLHYVSNPSLFHLSLKYFKFLLHRHY